MTRIFSLSIAVAALTLPALGAGKVDTSALTCLEYQMSGHNDMVAMETAFKEALKADPKLGKLPQWKLADMMDKVCQHHPDAKVMDMLQH
jgi:hypothetical protein